MQVLQGQCKKNSQIVKDFDKAFELAPEMIELCKQPLGIYPSALALAHCQVDHDTPLRFFVMVDGRVFINPKILIKKDLTGSVEGCYSYAFRPTRKVKRYDVVMVEHQREDGFMREEFKGIEAHIFQHEIDHFNGKSIYS